MTFSHKEHIETLCDLCGLCGKKKAGEMVKMKVGVLAVQGAFAEMEAYWRAKGADVFEIASWPTLASTLTFWHCRAASRPCRGSSSTTSVSSVR